MKKNIFISAIAIAIVFLAITCDSPETIQPQTDESQFKIEKIKVEDDARLVKLLSTLSVDRSVGGRTTQTSFGDLYTDAAVKVNSPLDTTVRYSLLLRQEPGINFENLVVRIKGNNVNYYKVRYEPSADWLYRDSLTDWSTYTGKLVVSSLENSFSIQASFEDGRSIAAESSTGRTKECCELISHQTRLGNWYVAIDCGDWYWSAFLRTKDCGGGSGGGSGGSGSGGGGGGGTGSGDGGWAGGGGGGGGSGSSNSSGGPSGGDAIGIFVPEYKTCPGDDVQVPLTHICDSNELNLINLLALNPYALVEIPCEEIPRWQQVAQYQIPQSVKDKVNSLQESNDNWFDDWAIQTLNGASGTIVNMDNFSINISSLPRNPTTGETFTPQTLLNYIRLNINDFVEGSSFEPYCKIQSICNQETTLWNSSNPLGAIIYIDIPFDDGAVICSNFQETYWYFSTLEAPIAGNHPVSGNRQFGFEPDGSGGYNFFVRGVDRFDSNTMENMAYIRFTGNPFAGADELWLSFQQGLSNFTNKFGGSSSIQEPITYRPDWDKVEKVMRGEAPISSLGCK